MRGCADVAVELGSFSKTVGFTGTRCACTVVPKSFMLDSNGNTHFHPLNRHSPNSTESPTQRAAEAVYVEMDLAAENCRIIT